MFNDCEILIFSARFNAGTKMDVSFFFDNFVIDFLLDIEFLILIFSNQFFVLYFITFEE